MNPKTMYLINKLPGEGQAREGVSLTHITIILARKSQLKLPCFNFFLQCINCDEFTTCTQKPSKDVKFYELPHSVHISSCNPLFLNLSVQHREAPLLATKWKQLSQDQLFAERQLRNLRCGFSKSNARITLLTQCSLTVRDGHRSAHTKYSDPMDFVIWIFHDFHSEDLKVLVSLDEIVQSCCESHFTDG